MSPPPTCVFQLTIATESATAVPVSTACGSGSNTAGPTVSHQRSSTCCSPSSLAFSHSTRSGSTARSSTSVRRQLWSPPVSGSSLEHAVTTNKEANTNRIPPGYCMDRATGSRRTTAFAPRPQRKRKERKDFFVFLSWRSFCSPGGLCANAVAGDLPAPMQKPSHKHLAGLNPEQRAAVLHTEGPLLILAGAGTGKTRTIVHRIAHIIESGKVDPVNVVGLTFTNRAADEMRERVQCYVGDAARAVALNTFHS